MQMLSDVVKVARRFQKAVRVDTDQVGKGALDGYVFSPSAAQIIKRMATQSAETGQGAFTWTGPYGGGKSSLALLLSGLLGNDDANRRAARAVIGARTADQITKRLVLGEFGRVVIPVVGRRADVEDAIFEAVAARLPTSRKTRTTSSLSLLRALAESSPGGLLLVIDEMGKFLEHAARDGGDVHFFQQIAEEASRSEGRLLVVGILHQAFDDYAHKLSRELRDEWLKVQGRFTDIPLNIAVDEQIELISRAIEVRGSLPKAELASAFVKAMRRTYAGDSDEFTDSLDNCWPLSPAVACLLGPISRRRFGQSQRSIFGFLNSAEPFGFQSFLHETPVGNAVFDLPRLWDYLRANLEHSILASPDGHRWALAADSLERCEARGGDAEHVAIVKSIALIDLFKERSGLSASIELLQASHPSIKPKYLIEVLNTLSDWSVVIFKKHINAYSIYAGSDFDIEGAVLEARAKMTGLDFSRLRTVAALQPILAKRFYHQTGSMFWFDVDIADLSSATETIRKYRPVNGATGLFLLTIGSEPYNDQKSRRIAKSAAETESNFPIAVGCSNYSMTLRDAAMELLALEAVRAGKPELHGDSVARREISARIARAASDLEDKLRDSFTSAYWFVRDDSGKAIADSVNAGAASLNIMASRLANAWFSKSPIIHSELLNRIKPSSNANAAQKALLRAMVEHPREKRLGIEGYPAEGGLYAALIERPGLHRQDPDNEIAFRFLPPLANNECGLLPLWEEAEKIIKQTSGPQISMAEIFAAWKAPPFGLRNGLIPVFGVAFILSRLEHLSIYLDGVYQVRVSSMVIDRLIQDWDSVKIRWSELSEIQRSSLDSLAEVVAKNNGFDSELACQAPTPLDIAKGLVRLVNQLPPWVLRTSSLPIAATKVRNIGKTANDPNKFLLDDLPVVIGLDMASNDSTKLATFVEEGLTSLINAYPRLMTDFESVMFDELRATPSLEGIMDIKHRAKTVLGLTGNLRLDAFATRLMNYELVSHSLEMIEGIVTLAANKPTRDWHDRDVDHARIELAALGQEFVKSEGFAHVKGRKDRRLSLAFYSSDPGREMPVKAEADITSDQKIEVASIANEMLVFLQGKGLSRDAILGVIAEIGAKLVPMEPQAKTKRKSS